MKRIKAILLLGGILLSFLSAGPFGINMGDSLQVLQEGGLNPTPFKDLTNYYYVSPKSTHPEFESYFVRLDEEEGVFFIKAIGKDIHDNGYGSTVKGRFSDLRAGIGKTYGTSKIIDIFLPSSIWKDLDDWLMSIRQGDRFYAAHWESKNAEPLQGDIKEIYLAVEALSSTKGYLVLEYYGTHHSRLSEKAKFVDASVF